MKITQGEIWFARFGEPKGREQGYDRPALILSNDNFNIEAGPGEFAVPLTTPRTRLSHPCPRSPEGTADWTKTSWAMVEQLRSHLP